MAASCVWGTMASLGLLSPKMAVPSEEGPQPCAKSTDWWVLGAYPEVIGNVQNVPVLVAGAWQTRASAVC
jgi:hypothetical protein